MTVLPSSRYNDYLHDPLSRCEACSPKPNGENAISARSDLNPANGSYPFPALRQRSHGGIDVKVPPLPGSRGPLGVGESMGFRGQVRCQQGPPSATCSPAQQVTSMSMAKTLSLQAVSGPTWDQVPAFQWSTSPFRDMLHMGHPDLWKFAPVEVSWG